MHDRPDTDKRESSPVDGRVRWQDLRSRAVALEALVALGLVSFAVWHLALHMHAMTVTGLWSDEIASIRDFSRPGLWTTLTRYPAPNNHIFFNALNALSGWAHPYHPLAARFWSFVAMGLLLVSGVAAFARRGSFFEAGLFAHLLFMSTEFVALGLQARGYGLLSLFTLLCAVLVWEHERDPDDAAPWLGLGAVAVLGIWTIPTFAFFVAPLMAIGLASRLRPRLLAITVLAALATALVHAPVAREMLEASRHYHRDWGRQLTGLGDLLDTLRLYLFHDASFVFGPNDTATLLWCAALLGFAFTRSERPESRAARALVASSLAFVVVVMALGTPPARTVAPMLVAPVFAAGLAFRARLRPLEHRRARAAAAAGLGLLLLPHDEHVIDEFAFEPRESWLEIARFLDRVLPEDVAVTVPYRLEQLMLYVERPRPFHRTLAADELGSERVAFLYNGLDVDPRHRAVADDSRLAAIRFPQNRGRHQTLFLALPSERSVRGVSLVSTRAGEASLDLSAAHDGDVATEVRIERPARDAERYFELRCQLEPGARTRSLIVQLDADVKLRRISADYLYADGSREPVPATDLFLTGSSIAVAIADEATDGPARRNARGAVDSVVFRLRPRSHEERRILAIREVWAYRERAADGASRSQAASAGRPDRRAP